MTRLITVDLDDPAVMEALAAAQHEIWAHWMRYQFSCCPQYLSGVSWEAKEGTGRWIPTDKVERWQRQMDTAYCDLSPKEQASDREQATKVMSVLAPLGQPVYCVPALPIDPKADAAVDALVQRMQRSAEARPLSREAKLANPYDAGAGGLGRLRRRSHE